MNGRKRSATLARRMGHYSTGLRRAAEAGDGVLAAAWLRALAKASDRALANTTKGGGS